MRWKDMISGCFGISDKKFAAHPLDEERAFELLKTLRKESVSWTEFSKTLADYLDDVNKSHMIEQVHKVKQYFYPWLKE